MPEPPPPSGSAHILCTCHILVLGVGRGSFHLLHLLLLFLPLRPLPLPPSTPLLPPAPPPPVEFLSLGRPVTAALATPLPSGWQARRGSPPPGPCVRTHTVTPIVPHHHHRTPSLPTPPPPTCPNAVWHGDEWWPSFVWTAGLIEVKKMEKKEKKQRRWRRAWV